MNYEIGADLRRAFTWMDDTVLIVRSVNEDTGLQGHCIALNTVRL